MSSKKKITLLCLILYHFKDDENFDLKKHIIDTFQKGFKKVLPTSELLIDDVHSDEGGHWGKFLYKYKNYYIAVQMGSDDGSTIYKDITYEKIRNEYNTYFHVYHKNELNNKSFLEFTSIIPISFYNFDEGYTEYITKTTDVTILIEYFYKIDPENGLANLKRYIEEIYVEQKYIDNKHKKKVKDSESFD